jgi:hypothetical protein
MRTSVDLLSDFVTILSFYFSRLLLNAQHIMAALAGLIRLRHSLPRFGMIDHAILDFVCGAYAL